jgi:DMSO/TMAO reductase YedYZ molybdopterin-dependent catalytic subunit
VRQRPWDAIPLDQTLDRRAALRAAASLPLLHWLQQAGRAPDRHEGPIVRQRHPENLEFPFATLDSFLTPNEQFYVRTHFEVPEIDKAAWRLTIEGEVERPLELSFDDLAKLPSATAAAVLECSGNGRDFLEPPQVGIRWELGGVSNAEWTGVPLAAILDRAGVRPGAVEVILEGADRGAYAEPNPKTPGVIPYARSLPLAKARRPEVLLAYRMNGADLPTRNGHPVRAVVPGWYGMASVKWLRKIVVTTRPFHGFFQTFMYTTWERRDGLPTLVPVTEIQVKAQIARPAAFEFVTAGTDYRVHGAAWAGESRVARVDLSADDGSTWRPARLGGEDVPFAWRLWEIDWKIPNKPGKATLMARATDDRGRTQPTRRDPLRRDAVISHVLPIEIEVR